MPRSWSEAVKACRQHPKRTNGRWCSCRVGWRYRLGVPDPVTGIVGAPKWSTTFPTKEAADADQRAVRTAIANKTFTADRGTTVAEFLTDWLARKEANGRKVSTIVGYRSIVDNHLIPKLGKHRLGALRPDHVQALLDGLTEVPSLRAGKSDRSVKAGTVRNVRACLRAALNDALRQQLVARNVAAELVEIPSVKRAKPVAVDVDRLGMFLAAVAGDPLEAMWDVDTTYGPRRAELLGLRWDDVDQGAGLIRITTTLLELPGHHVCPYCTAGHHRLLVDTPKSDAGERAWPLVPQIAASLMEHRRRQDAERELFGSDFRDHGLVFALPSGDPLRPSWVSSEFKRLMRVSGAAAGLERVPPLKTLRSSMVTALHEEGTSLEVIQGVTGHSPGSPVTKEHYLALTAERARTEFEAIATRLATSRSDRLSDHQPETVSDDGPEDLTNKEAS